jgi:preprotein translocase subunit SecG
MSMTFLVALSHNFSGSNVSNNATQKCTAVLSYAFFTTSLRSEILKNNAQLINILMHSTF